MLRFPAALRSDPISRALEEPLNWIRFAFVNVMLAWAAVTYGGQFIHQPGDFTLRIQFGLPVLILAMSFSLVAPLCVKGPHGPPVRALRILAAIGLCLPLAGLCWAASTLLIEPLAGAQIALLTAWNSPTAAAIVSLWAVLWTLWSFPAATPPRKELKEPKEPVVVEPASEWIGSSR